MFTRVLLLLGVASFGVAGSAAGAHLGAADAATSTAPQELLGQAIQILLTSPSGKDLLKKAAATWHFAADNPMAVTEHIKWGETSRTDAVLTRKLDPATGVEQRQREVTVYLRADSTVHELVLDLSHELTHATSRAVSDPYDPRLTAAKYIRASIEGKGGEADAMAMECKVVMELGERMSAERAGCEQYSDRAKIVRDFYRVGKWMGELRRRLGKELDKLPLVSDAPPRLFSSTGQAPYPVALLFEYEATTEVACDNSRRRIEVMADRKPAAVVADMTAAPSAGADTASVRFVQARCN